MSLRQKETLRVLDEVYSERQRQDARWGEQNHPVLPNPWAAGSLASLTYGEAADQWKAYNAMRVEDDAITWDGILLEEVYEALSEENPDKREAELIQVAAVAVAMVECSRRNRRA